MRFWEQYICIVFLIRILLSGLSQWVCVCVCVCACVCVYAHLLSHVWLIATPRTVTCQAFLSMGFSRQEYWSGLAFPTPGDLPDPGIKLASLASPALAGGFFTTAPPGSSGGSAVRICLPMQEIRVEPLGWKVPWGRKWQPTLVFWPGKSHGQRSLLGYSLLGHKKVRQDLETKQQHWWVQKPL